MSRKLFLVLATFAIVQSSTAKQFDIEDFEEWEEFKDFQRWREWKKEREYKPRSWHKNNAFARNFYHVDKESVYERNDHAQDPPPIDEAAKMARYIVNQNNWTSVATISSIDNVRSFPFVNVVSYSDGPYGKGSGMPYLFITPLDYTAQDLAKDNRATLSMTLAAADYCREQNYDPMDPRCARVYLTGTVKAVKNTTEEYEVAKAAVFGRHPWLAHMPADHHFFFAKLKIIQIALLDTFGGPKYITPKEYFAANQQPEVFIRPRVEAIAYSDSHESMEPNVQQLF